MTSVLAAVRPDSWNIALFLHVLGAMILVGGVLTCAAMLGFARGDVRLLRFGYWSLLVVALPGWILMRIGAQWIYSKEGWDDVSDTPTWLGIGYRHRRRRRHRAARLAHRRRHRRPSPAGRPRCGLAAGDDDPLPRLAHRLHRHRLGDGRQAGLIRPPHNDHGLHTREPAIGRQIQGSPLALRRTLRRTSSDFLRMCASAFVREQPGTCPSPTR